MTDLTNVPDEAAVQVIHQAAYAITANTADLNGPDRVGLNEALEEHDLATAIAQSLGAAGYFDAKVDDSELAAQLATVQERLDAFLGFAQRLAEAAEVAPESPLVERVEDLVDRVITDMLDPDRAKGGESDD